MISQSQTLHAEDSGGFDSSAKPADRADGPRGLPVIRLMGVKIHAITETQSNEHILSELAQGRGGVVITPNLDHLRRAVRDASYREMIERADLSVPDGMPLIVASRLQRTPLPERVAGSDMISSLSRCAAEHGRSVFLLGGDEGTAERAAEVLVGRFPALRIAGTFYPPMGFEDDAALMESMLSTLRSASPDIVFVALGSPKQERLIERIRSELPHAWWLGVGISFSFLCGDVRRAPPWMRTIGFEWLHRLCSEPRRLFRRYLIEGVPFAIRLMGASLIARFRGYQPQSDLQGERSQ